MTLLEEDAEGNSDLLEQIGDKLDKMEPQMFESKACELLHGLGFDKKMMAKSTKDMSGGWRMRVSLAQALFDDEALRRFDVFEIDAAKGRGEQLDRVTETVHVFRRQLKIDTVDVGKAFEQHRLAFHHRL